ncbi:hypothetical protein PIB30_008297 [Stylosanthes scabra]|uniref:Polyprotein n=1 Tax=Stylosanthes scabra TaxID=79078 RepID=A0ABU6S4G7_9FABA|nr:hypothetical protein [Stylosanthes scabra]
MSLFFFTLEKLPSSVKKTLSDKIDNFVEITHVPEDIKIPDLQKPLINPYTFYHRQKRSTITNIRHLITRNSSPPVKEIVQSSSLQQCGLQATTSKQYVTIEIPQDLIREYLAQNYTHLHLGAVRLILTLHGRKGLPITAKIALLDTTFTEYQNALIGALVTTLTNGSVILTISPDFTMRLIDPTLSQRIKIQVQLIGATQDAAAEQVTLHHQVLYRVQDHALDLKLPNSTGDALLMFHDKNHGPAIVNIPRMITTEELSSIVPLEWITNYEKAFPQQIPDVHTTTPPRITRASDGTPVYVSHIQGHFIWDVDPSMCDSDCDCQDWNDWSDPEDEDDYTRRRRKSKKKKKQSCTVSRRPDPPDELEYKPKFSLKRLSADDTRVTRRPYVTPPQGVSPHGYQAVTPQEEVLKWHTDNALNQNKVLNRIDHRLGTLEEKVDEASTQMSHLQAHIKELKDRLATQAIQLDHDLKTYVHEQYFGPDFYKKNQELIKIKAQLKQIEDDQARKTKPQTLITDPLSLYPPSYPAYTSNLYPPPSSPPQSSDYGSIFQSFHSLAKYAQPKTPIPPPVQPTGFKPKEPRPRPRTPWKPEFREFFPGDSSGTDKGEKEEKSSDRTINFMAQNDNTSEEDSSTDYSEETSEEDHIADIFAIAMVNPAGEDSDEGHVTDDEDHRQPMTIPGMTLPQVHTEFITRMTGNLRE